MSARYSTSPTLHLAIAESANYRRCQHLLHLALLAALCLLSRGGYPLFVLAMPLVLLSWQHCRQQAQAGWEILWQRGQWRLRAGGYEGEIHIERGHCLPWLTYIQWRDAGGARGRAWLFADCCERQQLRRLRVRLQLQRGV